MARSSPPTPPPSSPADPSAAELEMLRQLILGDSFEEVVNSALRPEAVIRVLPKAIAQAGIAKNELTRALMPTVEAAIRESVLTDEKVLAEYLFPVMGPSTRKSIGSAIGTLVQSLNQTLEYSVSPKSISWRIEALRTGKTFAEVVMLRTLVFQVEQVLLIHKETGLLLQQRMNETTEVQDPDLVSAMLTAIEDFIKDSFSVESGETLDTLELGDLNVLIEEGPQSILACVVRGNAPADLREVLRASQEKIHRLFGPAMEMFEGDADIFERCQPYLDDCLGFQTAEQARKGSKANSSSGGLSSTQKAIAWMVALALTCAMTLQSFWRYQHVHRWQRYVEDLSQQPGLVVLSENARKSEIIGLKDPLAIDPAERLARADLDPAQVKMSWKPYWSMAPELAGKRMQRLLNLPPSVTSRIDEQGQLHLTGRADREWIANAERLSQQMFGTLVWQGDALMSNDERSTFDRME